MVLLTIVNIFSTYINIRQQNKCVNESCPNRQHLREVTKRKIHKIKYEISTKLKIIKTGCEKSLVSIHSYIYMEDMVVKDFNQKFSCNTG